MHENIAYLLAL